MSGFPGSVVTPTDQLSRRSASRTQTTKIKTLGRSIVYISGHANCEQDFVEDFIAMLFERTVSGYPWELQELRTELPKSDPGLIIISQPLDHQKYENSREEIWNIVRETHPNVPVIWLSPDTCDKPDFLPSNDHSVRLLSFDIPPDSLRKFVELIAESIEVESARKLW